MTALAFIRIVADTSVDKARERENSETTIGQWQDKSRRCTASGGCDFSIGYGANSRCAPDRRSLRDACFLFDFQEFARCAERQP